MNQTNKKVISFIKREQTWLSFLLLIVISFTFLAWLQYNPGFACPDSYYHMKMAMLIKEQGVVKNFPWQQFTIFKNYYIDHHFLFHLFEIPFILFLQPVLGIKLSVIVFATLCIVVFYWFLRKQRIRYAIVYSFILLLITPFTFRISLARAQSLAVIFLLLGLYFIFHYRYWYLFFLSFFFVWLYDGFPLMLIFCMIFAVIDFIFEKVKNKKKWRLPWQKKHTFWLSLIQNRGTKVLLGGLSGTLAGIIINPYFPKNLYFYWYHIIKIAVVNYQKVIGVGAEWYPYKFIDLISNSVLATILLVIALVLFFFSLRKQSRQSITLLFIYLFFFIMTLRSKRNMDYYAPFAILFAATVINQFIIKINFKKLLNTAINFYFKRKILITIILVYVLAVVPTIIIRDIKTTKGDLDSGWPYYKFSNAMEWLKNNSPQGSIVVHSSWDEFPILFFHNTWNYYIVGLDPTFMYEYNKDLYWKWVDLTNGKPADRMYEVIKNDFNASYVFVKSGHQAMTEALENDPKIKVVYHDEEASIYQLE